MNKYTVAGALMLLVIIGSYILFAWMFFSVLDILQGAYS